MYFKYEYLFTTNWPVKTEQFKTSSVSTLKEHCLGCLQNGVCCYNFKIMGTFYSHIQQDKNVWTGKIWRLYKTQHVRLCGIVTKQQDHVFPL